MAGGDGFVFVRHLVPHAGDQAPPSGFVDVFGLKRFLAREAGLADAIPDLLFHLKVLKKSTRRFLGDEEIAAGLRGLGLSRGSMKLL